MHKNGNLVNKLKNILIYLSVPFRKAFLFVFLVAIVGCLELFSLFLFGYNVSYLLEYSPDVEKNIATNHFLAIFDLSVNNIIVASCVIILLNTIVLILITGQVTLLGSRVGNLFSDAIYMRLVNCSYEEFERINESVVISSMTTETVRLTNGVIKPVLLLIMRSISSIAIIIYLCWVNYFLAFLGIITIGAIYITIYLSIRPTLSKHGERVVQGFSDRQTYIAEAFGLAKEMRTYMNATKYIQRYKINSDKISRGQGIIDALAIVPRFAVEMFLLLSILVGLNFINNLGVQERFQTGDIGYFIFGLLRLLPNMQFMFASMTLIKGNNSSLDKVEEVLNFMPQPLDDFTRRSFSQGSLLKDGTRTIELRDLSKSLSNNQILKSLSVSITLPGLTVIYGDSGSGKSTLLEILAGIRESDSGYIFDGQECLTAKDRRQRFLLVPQENYMLASTVQENCLLDASSDIMDESMLLSNNNITDVLESINLSDKSDGLRSILEADAGSLSGGQKQRVALVRALISKRDLLLLDEPTSALDENNEKKVIDILKRLSLSKGLVVVTHSKNLINAADKLIKITGYNRID